MTEIALALVAGLTIGLAIAFGPKLYGWLALKRLKKPQEQCEVCGKWVPFNKAVIIAEVYQEQEFQGFSGVSASYCKKHDPTKGTDDIHSISLP